jgi:hypothetical protein
VVNTVSGTVSRIATVTGRHGKPPNVGLYSYPLVMSLTEGGALGVVVNTYAGQVSLVETGTGRVYRPITVGAFPVAVVFAR